MAISSQLLDITIDGARGILFNVTGGSNLTLYEVNQAAAIIKETAHPDVNLIFGAVVDPEMKDEIRVTVIATGFDRANMTRSFEPKFRKEEVRQAMQPRLPENVEVSAPKNAYEYQTVVMNTDDLDIPAFLRNRNRRSI